MNHVVPQARSEADSIIQHATAYKQEKILAAEGKAARYLSRLKGYKQNPKAHREKIYLEFVQSVYPKLGEIRAVDARQSDPAPPLITLRGRVE